MQRLCVFCGSSQGKDPAFAAAARDLGQQLAKRRIAVVYGGGNVGLMGIVADAALEAGGQVIGVIPQSLVDRELAHHRLTQLHVVGTMHERKALMAELSNGFVALPGGFGTLDEFCEVLTWAQLGFHSKPCALLNVAGFYDDFLRQMEHAVREGFIQPAHRRLVTVATTPRELLESLSPDAATRAGS
jgi:uncharacterized protein (TIGR00730 family)